MSLPISIPKTAEQFPLDAVLTLTRAAFALGIGLLIADKINGPKRQVTGVALLSLGVLAAAPLVLRTAMHRINRPESDRGSRNRLRSIRWDSGYSSDKDIY